MPRIIPNEETKVRFLTTLAATDLEPTLAEITAGVDLTPFLISINASTRGNVVQTPSFDTRFETSIPGTVTSTFEGDFYRDDTADTAWETLERGTQGYFVILRFGGSGADGAIAATDVVEVWPVFIVSRSATNLTSNTAQTFQVQCSVYQEPNEAATVAAA
jgi:hypothetical protein